MSGNLTNEHLESFNKKDKVAEAWYWALQSRKLKKGKAVGVTVMGKELALYRGEDGKVRALDAFCPHRGNHLGRGTVEGNTLRCRYHRWQFNEEGECVDVPCMESPPKAALKSWTVAEHYGLIWVWTGSGEAKALPFVPDLEGQEVDVRFSKPYTKKCHPNVVMCDAIDSQHFQSVHHLDGSILDLEVNEVSESNMRFTNTAVFERNTLLRRIIGRFYKKGPVTFNLSYWYGHSGSVSLGPDFFNFHVMFINRVGEDGCTEGQVVAVTKKRRGPIGWVFNRFALFLTSMVAAYFGKGDTPNFETINFNFQTPIKADHALVRFIKHVEKHPTSDWGIEPAEASLPLVQLKRVASQ